MLLLGLNNRYVSVVSRLRTLNDEKRRKMAEADRDMEYVEALRFESVMRQVPLITRRATYLRWSLMFLWIGVFCYLFTSLLLGVDFLLRGSALEYPAVYVFMTGILSAAVGVVFAFLDILLADKVLKLEADIY